MLNPKASSFADDLALLADDAPGWAGPTATPGGRSFADDLADIGESEGASDVVAFGSDGADDSAGAIPEPHNYSSTQADLPPDAADVIRSIQQTIDPSDWAEGGPEDAPHVTVKYGLHDSAPDAVIALLKNESPFVVRMGKTTAFPEGDDGVPLVVRVESKSLRRLNKKIAAATEHTDTHPTYQPHATVGYLKPGREQPYVGRDLSGTSPIRIDAITFSSKSGDMTVIPLTRGTKEK